METENETKLQTKPQRWWRRNKKKLTKTPAENHGGANFTGAVIDDPSVWVMLWHIVSFPFKMIGKFFEGVGNFFKGIGDFFDGIDFSFDL